MRGGGATAPQKGKSSPEKGGQKGAGGIASRPPPLGGGGIEVPLVSLRHPNNFDFFRPRRREKQQRRRVRTLFAVSPRKKNLQNAWLLWVLRFSVSWVCRVFCFILRSAGAAPKNRNEEKQGQGVAKEKKTNRNRPRKKNRMISSWVALSAAVRRRIGRRFVSTRGPAKRETLVNKNPGKCLRFLASSFLFFSLFVLRRLSLLRCLPRFRPRPSPRKTAE